MKVFDKYKMGVWIVISCFIFSTVLIFSYFHFSSSPSWDDLFINLGTEILGITISIVIALYIFEAYERRRWKPVEERIAQGAQSIITNFYTITMEYFHLASKEKMESLFKIWEPAKIEKDRIKQLNDLIAYWFIYLKFSEIDQLNAKLIQLKNYINGFLTLKGIEQIPELIHFSSELLTALEISINTNHSVYLYTHKIIETPNPIDEKKFLETNKSQFTRPLIQVNNLFNEIQNFITSKYKIYPWYEIQLSKENK